jgi:hypothetical protein
MLYENKNFTLAANIAIAHGAALLRSEIKNPTVDDDVAIVSTKRASIARGWSSESTRVFAVRVGETVVATYGDSATDTTYQSLRDCVAHFIAIVGPGNATRAIERGALGRCESRNQRLFTIEALLHKGDDVRGGGITLSKAHFDRKWKFAVRFGIGDSRDGIKRADDTCAYGGCGIYPTYEQALEAFERSALKKAV